MCCFAGERKNSSEAELAWAMQRVAEEPLSSGALVESVLLGGQPLFVSGYEVVSSCVLLTASRLGTLLCSRAVELSSCVDF